MNILFVNSTNHWAGIKTWMAHLGFFLHQRNHQVSFICRKGDALKDYCQKNSIPVKSMHFGADYNPLAVQRFIQLMKSEKIDLVITNISKDIRTAGMAARILGITHVNRLGLASDLKNSFRQRWEYQYWVDQVLVPSLSLSTTFQRRPELKGKVRNFQNVVKQVAEKPSNNKIPQLAVVAKLSRRKQVHLILEALDSMTELPWHLHIGGAGPEEHSLRDLAVHLGLEDRVTFWGFVEPYSFLENMDIGILYSTDEEMPNAVLEYMASGCAVVASDLPSIREVLRHNHNGLLVNDRDISNLEANLRRVITEQDLRHRLGTVAIQHVKESHNLENVFQKIEAYFKSLIMENAPQYQLNPA
ncbi:MAG: glycosyltransferase family 4 protein [bacterium]